MANLLIELPEDITLETTTVVLREIANTIEMEAGILEDRQLMDGSIEIKTTVGIVFITFELNG